MRFVKWFFIFLPIFSFSQEGKYIHTYRSAQFCDSKQDCKEYKGIFVFNFRVNDNSDIKCYLEAQESTYVRLTSWENGTTEDGLDYIKARYLYEGKGQVTIYIFDSFISVGIFFDNGAYMLFIKE